MPLVEIVLLAIVQGVTEFLPISSSGHLVLCDLFFRGHGESQGDLLLVEVALHAGTLSSVLAIYWHRLWRMLGADRRTLALLVVATLPAVVLGLTLEKLFESVLTSPILAALLLFVTALILVYGQRHARNVGSYEEMTYLQALLVGLAQAGAILPGISRSGATIVAGMRVGLGPGAAADFSFLMAVPVTAGACLLKGQELYSAEYTRTPVVHLALGALISAVVGMAAIRWLIAWLKKGRLHWFAGWCLAVGALSVAWLSLRPGSTPQASREIAQGAMYLSRSASFAVPERASGANAPGGPTIPLERLPRYSTTGAFSVSPTRSRRGPLGLRTNANRTITRHGAGTTWTRQVPDAREVNGHLAGAGRRV